MEDALLASFWRGSEEGRLIRGEALRTHCQVFFIFISMTSAVTETVNILPRE